MVAVWLAQPREKGCVVLNVREEEELEEEDNDGDKAEDAELPLLASGEYDLSSLNPIVVRLDNQERRIDAQQQEIQELKKHLAMHGLLPGGKLCWLPLPPHCHHCSSSSSSSSNSRSSLRELEPSPI